MKVIKYYIKDVYGKPMEYVHPSNKEDEMTIRSLTKGVTLSPMIRAHIERLSDGAVVFEEVMRPKS